MKQKSIVFLLLFFVIGCDTTPTENTFNIILPDQPDTVVAVCGENGCEAIEDAQSCPADCPPVCGDLFCDPRRPETSENCEVDCGPPIVISPIDVFAAGSCVGLVNAIQCIDESLCVQNGVTQACASVEWDIVNQITGAHVGGTTSTGAGGRFTRTGLPAGTYEVGQKVRATDGKFDTQSHPGIEVKNP